MVWVLFCAGSLVADDNYTQPGTGFVFPPKVAGFVRTHVTPYQPDYSDIEVDYDNSPYTVHLSVYVYPASAPLKLHYEGCKAGVLRIHPDAKLIEEKPMSVAKGGVTFNGYYALYSFRAKMIEAQETDLFSQLIVFRRDNNYVLFRISYLVSDRNHAERAITDFIDQYQWPPGGKDASQTP